jgi:protein-disulfide isomerase
MLMLSRSLPLAASLLTLAAACRPADSAQRAAEATSTGARPAAAAAPTAAAARQTPSDSISALADRGRILGNERAPLWIIEASDFQCPYCKTWHDSAFAPLVDQYVKTGKVRLAYLNFPLNQHANALPAAEAAMCASVQNRFWPMHDALFNAQPRWQALGNAVPAFDSLAAQLGVSMPAWRECMSKHLTRPLIEADYERSQSAGVQSTPSFFVGDQLVSGAQPFAYMRQIIEAQLARRAAAR